MATAARTHRHNPYRTAIAAAITLERSWDRLSAFLGDRPAPFDRIVPQGRRYESPRSRLDRLNLPHPLDPERLRLMHRERLEAIDELAEALIPTLGAGERAGVATLVAESRTLVQARRFETVPRKGRVCDPWDRDLPQDEAAAIARAADAPFDVAPTDIAPTSHERHRPGAPLPDRRSFAIDLVLHSMLVAHGVDRDALHRELSSIRSSGRETARHDVSSPAARSNSGRILRSLGPAFPPARFILEGASLDVSTMEVLGRKGTEWLYERLAGRHYFVARTDPSLMPYHEAPGRSLAAVTGDARWHTNIVVRTASDASIRALGVTATRMTLSETRTHVDPPGSPAPIIHRTAEAAATAGPGGRRTAEYAIYDHVPAIRDALTRHGLHGQTRIVHRDGAGLVAEIGSAPDRRVLVYRYETLADGREAIDARTRVFAEASAKRRRRSGFPAFVPSGQPSTSPDMTPSATAAHARVADTALRLVPDEELARALASAERTDVLLADMLEGDCDVEPDPEWHVQSGVVAVSRAMVAPGVEYRLERFERVMGRITHAIGVVETTNPMTATQAERLRDGDLRPLLDRCGRFSRSQVRKVSRADISVVTVRTPLCAAPAGNLPPVQQANDA